MAVITNSRQVGSGSQELAQLLCAEPNLTPFDQDIGLHAYARARGTRPAAAADGERPGASLSPQSDENAAEYLRSFYHVDADDPTMYHLTVNAGRLGIEAAAALFKRASGMLPPRSELLVDHHTP